MSAFNIWRENPPPRGAVVMAKYELTGDTYAAKWQIVRACNRGCCVFDYPSSAFGAMTLPKFWREPTADEMSAAEKLIDSRPNREGSKNG